MAKYRIMIPGRFASLNEFIEANRTHKQKGNKMKQQDQHDISMYIMQQLHRVRIEKPIRIRYRFYEPNKKRDLDNISGYFHKVFQDSLVNCGVIVNDNWHYIVGFSDEFFVDSKYPRIEVEIQEVGGNNGEGRS